MGDRTSLRWRAGSVTTTAMAGALSLMSPAVAQPRIPIAQDPAAAPALVTARSNGADVRSARTLMRITALGDDILRVQIGPDGTLAENASWAVPAGVRARSVRVTPAADGFATATLRVHVDRAGRLIVTDQSGHIVIADAPDPRSIDGTSFALRKQLPIDEHIFGLGDKTGSDLDRRGNAYVDWNTDAFGFSSSQDPIYKSIPFFIGVNETGQSYGLLLDNTWRAWFDFGHKDADTLAFGAPGGPIDYYIIAGPTTADVVRRYTDLTGKAPLPPQWAFGYQQSRYSYMSADEVRQIAGTLRADRVPTDVIWLDIDYQDRNRPFTVNSATFPDLAGLVRDMGRQGIKLVAITDLHIADLPNQGYAPYDSGAAGNHFVHNPDGSVYVAPVWPGPSVFPDFTDASARAWWGTLFRGFVKDGVAGFWNDMNEPAIFATRTKTMPLDTVHHIASDDFGVRDASHAEIHNVYGMENTRATFDGLTVLEPDERPFVMTRASYAGGQRYSVTWTGDNSSTWDHLKLSIHQLINLGLSGFSYTAADVGGFAGGPSADLLTRWFEIGAFTPVFRDHSAKGTPRAEPWVDGAEQLAIRRRYVEERYRLMPYLYALADQNARTGDPIMRPVFYDYPAAITALCDQSSSFTVGAQLLVAPPPKIESPEPYDVCLPGGGWYDYWTGMIVNGAGPALGDQPVQSASQATAQRHLNGDVITETPKLDRLPVFVRAGTILPRQPIVQSTAQTPGGPLTLDVYPGDNCEGTLYADDGHSMAFTRGILLRQTIRCVRQANGLHVSFGKREGYYKPWWHSIAVTVHGWAGPGHVRAGGHSVPAAADATTQTITFTIPDQPGQTDILLAGG